MKVVISNTVLLNGGDAAILLAVVRHVRGTFGEDAEIVVADTQPDLARTYYPDFDIIAPLYVHAFPPKREARFPKLHGAWRFARWYSNLPRLYAAAYALGRGQAAAARAVTTSKEWETLRHYAEADVVISTGGTYLVENYWLAPRIFDFRITLLLGKPLILYTQSMGPFESPSVRSALKSIFRNAALVLLRDEESMSHLHDLCDPNEVQARLAADAVFSLADSPALLSAAGTRMPERGLRAAISVRRWPFFKTMSEEEGMQVYRSAVAEVVETLVRHYDAAVTFVSTCQGVDGYAYDDSQVAQEIADLLSPDVAQHVSVDAGFHRPDDLIARLPDFDLIVATRMHMAILGLAAGVPVLPISYEFKTRALFERLGLGHFACDIDHLSDGRLTDVLQRFVEELPQHRGELFRKVEEERRRADSAAEYLDLVATEALAAGADPGEGAAGDEQRTGRAGGSSA